MLKHLETHPRPPENGVKELANGEQNETNRCPRCSTAFSFRKTLIRHIKKNRCRGGNLPAPSTSANTEEETGVQLPEKKTNDLFDIFANREEEEEMDMEASLKLGCPTSLFRFACTLCSKMFNSYVNMCRHRRLAHGRYGICSPHWLLSQKLTEKTALQDSITKPVTSPQTLQNSQDLSHIVHNANDNLNQFIDGKNKHIHSTTPIVSYIFKTACFSVLRYLNSIPTL